MSAFAAPAPASGWTPQDHQGNLLVFEVLGFEPEIQTTFGPSPAVSATIHDVDLGESAEEVLVFPKVMVGSLKGRVGQMVLARLGQGQAKPGQSAPWTLDDASGDPAAVAKAEAYLASLKDGFAPPAAAPAATEQFSAEQIAAAQAVLAMQGK